MNKFLIGILAALSMALLTIAPAQADAPTITTITINSGEGGNEWG